MKKPAKKNAQALHKLKARREKREAKEKELLTTKGAKPAKKPKPSKALLHLAHKIGRRQAKEESKPVEKFLATFPPVASEFQTLEAHELASRFPAMSHEEYEGLKAAILSHKGLIHPIILFDGKILDGRHRYEACTALDIPPRFEEFPGDYQQAVDYVINASAHRNTSMGQRAWCAAQFKKDLAETRSPGPKKISANDALDSGKSSELAGLRFSVSPRLVEMACKLQSEAPDLFAQLGNGSLNVNQASNRLKLKSREKEVRKLKTAHTTGEFIIVEADCIEEMDRRAKTGGSGATVIFADPPYNNGWKYDGDSTGDSRPADQFITWCGEWIDSAARLLADNGSLFILIDDAYSDHIGLLMRQAGLHKQPTIVWWETFGNHVKDGLTPCARYIHYYTKQPSGFIFNTDVREESARQQCDDKRANPDGKIPTTVWKISRKQGTANDRVPFADAPPQLPVEIPERCILIASNPGDIVLDPFNGNGTTGIAAVRHGRHYVGIDRSAKYARQSRQWIASQLQPPAERKAS